MSEKQHGGNDSKRGDINQQIDWFWLRPEFPLCNHVFAVAGSLAVFVRVVVDLFHSSNVSASTIAFKEARLA